MDVEELKTLAEKVKIARAECEKASSQKKEAEDLKKLLEGKFLDALEECDLVRFDFDGQMYLLSHAASAKVPKEPENRKQFFDYLREQGVFEDMATVHSSTINKFVADEEQLARERGDLDFQVPGLTIDYRRQLSIRKK